MAPPRGGAYPGAPGEHMAASHNHREFTRIPIQLRCELRVDGRVLETRATRNLSMKGLFVELQESLAEGSPCEVLLRPSENADVEIRAEGEVVRCFEDGVAVQFTRILGIESFEHLRRMVLYNAEDPGRVEAELDAHLGIRKR